MKPTARRSPMRIMVARSPSWAPATNTSRSKNRYTRSSRMITPSAWPSKTRAYISGVALRSSAIGHQHVGRALDDLSVHRELALDHLLHDLKELDHAAEGAVRVRAVDREFH